VGEKLYITESPGEGGGGYYMCARHPGWRAEAAQGEGGKQLGLPEETNLFKMDKISDSVQTYTVGTGCTKGTVRRELSSACSSLS
jgi:hypothetical protein